jgi:hypothetical protein
MLNIFIENKNIIIIIIGKQQTPFFCVTMNNMYEKKKKKRLLLYMYVLVYLLNFIISAIYCTYKSQFVQKLVSTPPVKFRSSFVR